MPLTTSKSVYREGFGPFMPGVHVAPYPYALHSDVGEAACAERALADLNLLLRQESTPAETCAVLIEPVLGEGGYVPLPPQFLQSLSTLCRESGMLLIVDEVQSGFGRTGHLFATDGHYGTAPDILVMAKGLASGMPLSAVATRAELADAQAPGSMGGTYAGNAVACAASLATLQVMDDEGLVANAAVQGERMKCLLHEIAASGRYPIRDVRGLGLMIGVEFDADVPPGTATAVSKACLDLGESPMCLYPISMSVAVLELGGATLYFFFLGPCPGGGSKMCVRSLCTLGMLADLLLLTTSVFETVRFIPPLCITEKEVTDGVGRFEAALQRCFA
jgi:4-aminobutyrate aminotransferase